MTKQIFVRWLEKINLLVWSLFFAIYWSRAYVLDEYGGVVAKSLGTWADGAAHLTYISAMAYQPAFPQHLPVFLGKPFIYPFVTDGLSALLARLGLNVFSAYSIMGIVLSLGLILFLYRFYVSFTESTIVSVLAVNIFFLSGGLGFVAFIEDVLLHGWHLWLAIPKEYTRLEDYDIFWLNIITGELIPQRAMLLGLIVGLFVSLHLWQLIRNKLEINSVRFLFLGTLVGLLPIIHAHTLIALAPVIVWVFLLDLFRHKNQAIKRFQSWLWFIIPSAILSLSLVFLHISPASDNSFVSWYPGWLAKSREINWIYFWWLNWGFFGLFSLIGFWFISWKQRLFLFPFVISFVTANLILFQPYDWDNSKVLTWVYLMFAPVAAQVLVNWFTRGLVFKTVAITSLVLMTAAGFLDVVRQLQPVTDVGMYTAEEITLAEVVRKETPADSLFLTSDYHVHPIPTLTGRQILMGYRGWLWTYGINYAEREKQVLEMYNASEEGLALMSDFEVDYVVIGNHEQEFFSPNQPYFENNFEIFHRSKHYTIYKTNLF